MPCAQNQLVQISFGDIAENTPKFVQRRARKCEICHHRDGDTCTVVEAKHPGKSSISQGIQRPELRCPEGRWKKEPTVCPKCQRKNHGGNYNELCRHCINKARLAAKRRAADKSARIEIDAKVKTAPCQTCGRKVAVPDPEPERVICIYCENKSVQAQKKEKARQIRQRGKSMGSAFRTIDKTQTRFVTEAQFARDTLNLIGLIPTNIEGIVGIARSGLSAATRLSMYLHLPLWTLRQTRGDIIDAGNGWRLGGQQQDRPPRKNVLVVDDTCMTGNSLRATKHVLERHIDQYTTATVYCNPLAAKKPDIHSVDLPWPHLLEWNLFNSVLSPNMACDFDGIFCHDCPAGMDDDGPRYLDFIRNAKPLYVPRRAPVPLIVTARIEKYRKPTEEWLARHGIRFHQLIMHPAATLGERMRDDIAGYKAKHFGAWAQIHKPRPAPLMFVESCNIQARRIAALSKRLVVCPAAGAVYQ